MRLIRVFFRLPGLLQLTQTFRQLGLLLSDLLAVALAAIPTALVPF